MAEYELNLWDYWRIIHKRKWIIISVFLVSIVSSYLFVEKVEPIYRSTVTLYMNSQGTPVAEVTGSGVTFWGGGTRDISTQLELIRTSKILERVASEIRAIKPDMTQDQIQQVIMGLKGKISVAKEPDTELITISVTDTDPERAKATVEAVAEVFMQTHWEDKVREARNTKVFIEEQIKKIDAKIVEIRKKMQYLGVAPGSAPLPTGELDVRVRLAQLELQLESLRERYTDNYPGIINILAEIESLRSRVGVDDAAPDEAEFDMMDIDTDRLQSELEINRSLYITLKERYEKANMMEATKVQDIEVVNPAVVPRIPVVGQVTANFVFSGAIGLILGIVAAFIVESLDTSIGTIEDVEEYTKLPVLGVIPQIEFDKGEDIDFWKTPPPAHEIKAREELMKRMITQYQPKSPVAEAYRNLQTYIKFTGIDKMGNCLMFTSSGEKEGKTITSVNSALSMAQMGYKVLLIDADLRKPTIHSVFGIKREVGLTEAVLGTFKLDDVVKTIDDVLMGNIKSSVIMKTYGMENLNIITAGHLPTNPTEILGSDNMDALIKEVKSKFQVVIFDSAPVLPVTDSCVLSSKTDGVIIVYKAGKVSRGALRRSKMQIENAKGKVIGIVLNSMRASDMRFGSPFYYYYQKYYGEEQAKTDDLSAKRFLKRG
jgi:capsular exopolysaccharide synthesis family protein